MLNNLLENNLDFENELDYELGISAKRKKRRAKIKKKLKGAVKAIASGGISLAVKGLKKTKLSKKTKKTISKFIDEDKPKKVLKKIQTKTVGDCKCKDEMAKLVAAKLVSQLGPPLDHANKILANMELQRQATYEHRKLMSDHEFRRKVLEYIAKKAKTGNRACQRTLRFLRS